MLASGGGVSWLLEPSRPGVDADGQEEDDTERHLLVEGIEAQ